MTNLLVVDGEWSGDTVGPVAVTFDLLSLHVQGYHGDHVYVLLPDHTPEITAGLKYSRVNFQGESVCLFKPNMCADSKEIEHFKFTLYMITLETELIIPCRVVIRQMLAREFLFYLLNDRWRGGTTT